MSKILEQNGFKYSREPFEGYTHRAKFRLSVSKDWREDSCIDIYTSNPNKEDVNNVIFEKTSKKVIECKMEHWTTKEQDEILDKFLSGEGF